MRNASMALAILLGLSTAGMAGSFPSRPIHVVVPNPPGGTADLVARSIAPALEALGQPVVVDLKPGGNGIIGLDAVARAPADGHTLVLATTAIVTTPLMLEVPFAGTFAFAPVAGIASTPIAIVVHPSMPVSTIQELVALARSRPVNCAASTPASAINLAVVRFKRLAKADFNVIPYQGGVQAVLAVVGGHASIAFVPVSDAAPHLASGKLRAIAVTSARRDALLPDVPTLAESGYPGFEVVLWIGLAAPAGTPKAVVETLGAAILRRLESADVRERFASLGIRPMPMDAERFGELLRHEVQSFSDDIRTSGFKAE